MTVGVTDWVLDEQGPGAAKECAALGFEALQLGIAADGDEQRLTAQPWLNAVRSESERNGVRIAGIALNVLELHGTGGSQSSPAFVRALQLVRDAAQAARTLGASLVYVPAFGNNRIDGETAAQRASDFLRMACRIAAAYGITVASENTLGFRDNLRLVSEVGESNFRILIDTYNPRLWGHDARTLILALRDWLADQAHVKNGIGTAMGAAPLNVRDGQTRAALDAFMAVGYRGTFFLENDYRGAKRRRARGDIKYVRRHFRDGTVKQSTATRA